MSVQELTDMISPKFNEEVVHGIIKKFSKLSDIQVKNIKIGDTSKKGDSYLSTICRFVVEAVGINGRLVFLPKVMQLIIHLCLYCITSNRFITILIILKGPRRKCFHSCDCKIFT